MGGDRSIPSDSRVIAPGAIPGLPGQPALRALLPTPSPIPLVIAVPHAGRHYPPCLIEAMRDPAYAALKLEDRHADLLAAAVAAETGAALVTALAPRAMIDLNRAIEDMDWEMVAGGPPRTAGALPAGRRVRSGLGLVPRRLPGLGEIWNRRLEAAELRARIENVHQPYHRALEDCMRGLRDRWGAALLLDLHSMPPLAPAGAGGNLAQFVLGDRFGASCDGALCAAAFDELARMRQRAAHNRPYAGGYVLDRHAAPGRGLHAMQIEVCRSAYLDGQLAEPGPGFAGVVRTLSGLVRRLATEVAALGRAGQWPQAAE